MRTLVAGVRSKVRTSPLSLTIESSVTVVSCSSFSFPGNSISSTLNSLPVAEAVPLWTSRRAPRKAAMN